MGTYTTNYQLFMPSIGEQGWGDLVNGNFSTIDTAIAGLNTRMGNAETNITSLTTRMGTAESNITSNASKISALQGGTFTSITANMLYLPFSTAYALKVLESNTQTITLTSQNWSTVTSDKTYTASSLGKYLSNIIRPNHDLTYTVTVSSPSTTYVYGSIDISLNGVQKYSSGSTRNAISYTLSNLKGSDSIRIIFKANYQNSTGGSGSSNRTATYSITPQGI